MGYKNYYIIIILVLTSLSTVIGQNQNSLHSVKIVDCFVNISDEYLVRSTVKIVDGSRELNDGFVITDSTIEIFDSICSSLSNNAFVEYRTFPFKFNNSLSLLDTNRMRKSGQDIYGGYDFNPFEDPTSNALIDSKGLNYSGSLARGFSVGNSQSLVLNSNFDLQMVGNLGNGLRIAAAISDDNIPIQPEGNTQVLQEFDKVFIEVSKDQHSVVAGDYVLKQPKSYFIRYLKKLKGLGGTTSFDLNDKIKVSSNANIANSRGKFARQSLDIREGNQGPYRLKGNNNERFIIVLSGSEKVYYNGELLSRGFENDYIIDYNTADVTFSPNRLVSKETRVIVEFEYTDQNYFRTLYALQSNIVSDKWNVNVNFYSEQDSKTSSNQFELDSTAISILKQSGDDPNASFRSGIRDLNLNNISSSVTYKQAPNPNFPAEPAPTILIFTAEADSAEVTATFTEVGFGNGAYSISLNSGVNGRVYEYVGAGNGAYSPVINLIPPEQKRAMSIGGQFDLSKNTRFEGELAMSDFDNNRFSAIDDDDNVGVAGFVGYNTTIPLGDSTGWQMHNGGKIELLQNQYNPLNPYRNAEFSRDWNTTLQFEDKERFMIGDIGISKSQLGQIGYNFSNYKIGDLFDGIRHGLDFSFARNGFKIRAKPNLTITEDQVNNTRFFRPNGEISKSFLKLDKVKLTVNYEGEINEIKSIATNELSATSYSFDYVKSKIETNPDRDFNFGLGYNKRVDRFSDLESILPAIDIDEYEFFANWKQNDRSDLSIKLKTRNFEVTNATLVDNESSKQTVLGGLNYKLNALNGGVLMNTNYQLNSGQEPKLEYVYQRVENSIGDYVYIGADTATVQNVNDFRFDPSNPLSEYIRIAIPNNEFIRTNNLALNQSLRITMRKILRQDSIPLKGFRKFLSKFSTNSTIRILNKSNDESGKSIDPFAFRSVDSSLVAFSTLNTHALFFNRADPKYDIGLTFRDNGSKTNQINGFEQRALSEKELRLRLNVFKSLDFILAGTIGNRTYDSEIFDQRDLDIDFTTIRPELNYRIGTQMRIVTRYKYDRRIQSINDMEEARSHDISLDFNYRQRRALSFDIGFSMVKVYYTGAANSAIEYDILDGLKDGLNYLWQTNFTKRLGNNIDLTLSYNGRKTGSNATVHVGRVQAKATF